MSAPSANPKSREQAAVAELAEEVLPTAAALGTGELDAEGVAAATPPAGKAGAVAALAQGAFAGRWWSLVLPLMVVFDLTKPTTSTSPFAHESTHYCADCGL